MEYQVRLKPKAEKELAKIPDKHRQRILIVLQELRTDPFLGKKMAGEYKGTRSVSIWPYRVVYMVDKKILLVLVIKIGHRQGVYK